MPERLHSPCLTVQMLVAAAETVPDSHAVHSLHGYFILAGPCILQVSLHDVEVAMQAKGSKLLCCIPAECRRERGAHPVQGGTDARRPFVHDADGEGSATQ